MLVGLVPLPPASDLTLAQLEEGRQTALGRIQYFLPGRYSDADISLAGKLPIERIIYPFKDAWDRHADQSLLATWEGVSFYYDLDPGNPSDLENMHPLLKDRLKSFILDARSRLRLVGLDHIGIYNDRLQRGSRNVTSAHAFGQAMDLSGFRFSDGFHIRVADHEKNPEILRKLNQIEVLLRRHFDIVVDWREDPKRHFDHFHVEVSGPRDFPYRSPVGP